MWFSWQSGGLVCTEAWVWSSVLQAWRLVHDCNPSRSEMEVKGHEFKLHSKFKASLGFKRLDFMGACRLTIPETIIVTCGGRGGMRPSVYLERMNTGS